MQIKTPIKGYKDLEVYQDSYKGMLSIFKNILTSIPIEEKYDLTDQLRRSCKAIPRLIAEGYAKRNQKLGFQKYLNDALAECNETIVSLEQVRDLYKIKPELASELLELYNKNSKQIYSLLKKWKNYQNTNSNFSHPSSYPASSPSAHLPTSP